MSEFDQAEIYIKEILSMPIELAVQDLNNQLTDDKEVPGLKLMVTGGQAIQAYFPNSPPLRTHDFDLKLVAPSKVVYTDQVRDRMMLLAKGIVRYIAIVLNKYIKTMLDKVSEHIKNNFDLILVVDENKDVFTTNTDLRTTYLNTVTFKLQSSDVVRTNSISDVYVVDPENIYHYHTFTGDRESNFVLSETGGDYYIPYKEINGIPYAGLGYLVWDTFRMVVVSAEEGLSKYPRYVEKRDALIAALNAPNNRMSCNSMKEFMLQCEKKYNTCNIKGKKLEGVNAILRFAISEGLIPPEPGVIRRIQQTYDADYLCGMINRALGN